MKKSDKYRLILSELTIDNFDYIKDKYNYTQSEMLGLLDYGKRIKDFIEKEEMFYNLLLERQFLLELNESRVGLITDTHIGSKKDNFYYIEMAYKYFKDNDINIVLHLGDFFDTFNQQEKHTQEKIEEICNYHLQRAYDYYPDFLKTYIIFGNHDELFKRANIDLMKELNTSYLIPLGYGGSYIKIYNYKIFLEHEVKSSRLVPPLYNYDAIIGGHSHFFKYKKTRQHMKITSCSDIQPNGYFNELYYPGFAILNTKSNLTIDGYTIRNNEIKKVIKVKIKD